MTTERIKRRIERLLDQVEEAADSKNWQEVHDLSRETLALDSENADAVAFLELAGDMLGSSTPQPPAPAPAPEPAPTPILILLEVAVTFSIVSPHILGVQ